MSAIAECESSAATEVIASHEVIASQTPSKHLHGMTAARKAGPGKPAFDREAVHQFEQKAEADQRVHSDAGWRAVDYILLKRARAFAMSATKKDFKALKDLVTSAAISRDKAYPIEVVGNSINNFTLNLFGGSGAGQRFSQTLQGSSTLCITSHVDDHSQGDAQAIDASGDQQAISSDTVRVSHEEIPVSDETQS